MPAGDIEKNLLDQISDQIKTLGANHEAKINELRKEINGGGGLKAEHLQAELDKTFGPKVAALQAEQKRLMGVIADLETRGAPGSRDTSSASDPRSIGRQFVESEAYKQFTTAVGKREYIAPVEVKRFWGKSHREIKASTEMDTTNYGSAVVPFYQDGIITVPKRMPLLRRLCQVVPVGNTNSVIMDREVAEYDIAAKLTALANAGATTITVDNAAGFRAVAPFNELTLDNGSATEVRTITGVNTVTNVITFTPASSINMAAGDRVSARAYGTTPEGLLAPASFEELEDYTVQIGRLATALKVNIDVLNDINQAEAFIQDRLLARHGRNEDLNFLYGDGNTNKIRGIFQDSDVPTRTYTSGSTLDFLIDTAYALAEEDYVATAIAVAPQIHKKVVQTKGSDGHYIYLPSASDGAPDRVYAIPFLWSNQLSSTQGIAGDFQMGCKILDREDGTVEAGTVDDDFRRFKRTLIATSRVGFGIPLPRAIRRLAGL